MQSEILKHLIKVTEMNSNFFLLFPPAAYNSFLHNHIEYHIWEKEKY